jgi:adenylate cyclase
MSRLPKAFALGLLTTILGAVVSFIPPGYELEEKTGLSLLFKLRGPRPAPQEVVIVTLDKASSEALKLSSDPAKWPRSYHARLTEALTQEGVAVIAFDILFEEPRSKEEDGAFAEAVQRAKNVVLCELLSRETVSLRDGEGTQAGRAHIEKLVPPIPPLAQSAVALAPFPLPKVPDQVTQYWTFKASAGDIPTLPVVAFQIFARHECDDFLLVLEKLAPSYARERFMNKDSLLANGNIVRVIQQLREIFLARPSLGADLLLAWEKEGLRPAKGNRSDRTKKSLIRMYQGPESAYLNFYGPPGSISTIPYHQILLQGEKTTPSGSSLNLRDKAVFVGVSELLRPEQKDGFYTVFAEPDANEMSGVEIAATAFANLLESFPVRPLGLWGHLGSLLIWGAVPGLLCYMMPVLLAALSLAALDLIYLFFAKAQFASAGLWLPVGVPLLVQGPLAFFGAILWKYFDTHKEREHIRRAIGYYLPNNVINQLARNVADIKANNQLVYGTCLFTDAGQYTTLSENMDPVTLNKFMSAYYEALFKQVKKHEGIIINIVGDSMLALWAGAQGDASLRERACMAALDIGSAVKRFNDSSGTIPLPTRLGLHSGTILLGNIGAEDHFEYRPMGDIVNTASRIEGLNKYLGTGILASEEVSDQLQGFVFRELGEFLLAGKSNPVVIRELICRDQECRETDQQLCSSFSMALSAYRAQKWEEALDLFAATSRISGRDDPSAFYIDLCRAYQVKPPEGPWSPVISLKDK